MVSVVPDHKPSYNVPSILVLLQILGKLVALLFKAFSIQGCLIQVVILDIVTMSIFTAAGGVCVREKRWGGGILCEVANTRGAYSRETLNRGFADLILLNRGQMWSAFLQYMYVYEFVFKIYRHLQEALKNGFLHWTPTPQICKPVNRKF